MQPTPSSDENPYAAPCTPVTHRANAAQSPRAPKRLALDIASGLAQFMLLGTPLAVGAAWIAAYLDRVISLGQLSAPGLPNASQVQLVSLGAVLLYLPTALLLGIAAGLLRPRLRSAWTLHLALLAAACAISWAWVRLISSVIGEATLPMALVFPPLLPTPMLLWLFARPQRGWKAIDPA